MSATATPDKRAPDVSGIRTFLAKNMGVPVEKVTIPNPEKLAHTPEGDARAPGAVAPTGSPPAQVATPVPVKTPKTTPEPPTPTPPAPGLTPEQLIDLGAQAAARAVAAHKPTEPAKPDPNAGLSADEREDLTVIERMAELYPDKYKDAPQEYRESISKLAAYKAEWEKEHPGMDFDQDAAEHQDWMEKNVLGWDDKDYRRAEVAIAVQESLGKQEVAAKERREREQRAEEERQKRLAAEMPAIIKQQIGAAKEFLKTIAPEFAEVLSDAGVEDREKVKALQEAAPEAHDVVNRLWNQLDVETSELMMVMAKLKPYDKNNPVHVELDEYTAGLEQSAITKSRAGYRENGRPYLPLAEWLKKSPAEREQYWSLTADRVILLRAHKLAAAAKKDIAAREEIAQRIAKARGVELPARNAKVQAVALAPASPAVPVATAKPVTPIAGGGPKVANPVKGSGADNENALSRLYRATL
jgi:hypothetical protein